MQVFDRDAAPDRGAVLTDPFWRMCASSPEQHERLAAEYDVHVSLVEDLALELTRAANLVCDRARETIAPSFGRRTGALTVTMGPMEDFSYMAYRPEYRSDERSGTPYPGLEAFKVARFSRDVCCGRRPAADA
jgi:hypothetical protein